MTDRPAFDRRAFLAALGSAGLGSLAGCSALGGDSTETASTAAPTASVDADVARDLAARFAPTLYFDADETWFPTDPRSYASDRDGETVVDGFDAFDGYHATQEETGERAPEPTVFYNVVRYEDSSLTTVQYWFYSVFDQFTTNFHWHDWEVLHVFVDTADDEPVPQLYVASSHSRSVPNNEFLDPDPARPPRVLSELGSHSSALSLNDRADRFQRLPTGGTFADITNRAFDRIEDAAEIPIAYGLPRDEGARLPYVVPELDGAPVYEDERLPSVTRDSLVSEALTVRSFDALSSPPTDLPARSTGLVFGPEATGERDADADADIEYALVSAGEVEHITEFTGPQLSFEFAVPTFAEDAIASHLTTTSTPWSQSRYADPAADITDPTHRSALAERYDVVDEPSALNTLFVRVTEAVTDADAPDGEGVTTRESGVESVLLLESDPEAAPTFGGLGVLRDVPAGEHRLTVNGAGSAPHSETVQVGDAGPGSESATETESSSTDGDDGETLTTAGVGGEIPLVARESATKVEVDADGTDRDLTSLALEDDFAGRLYDAPLSGPDAVYVHRGGAYTVEVRDSDDEIGAFRVNPDPNASAAGDDSDSDSGSAPASIPSVRIDDPRTGKASLATFLADIAAETAAAVAAADERDGGDSDDSDDSGTSGDSSGTATSNGSTQTATSDGQANAVRGLAQALESVAEAANRAAERAEAGERGRADESLDTVASRLERVAERLAEARGELPGSLSRATDRRLEQARRRSEQARAADTL
ncbi:hypothetical protein C454_12808 [Haloferax gibbonsii ATCC 33959]|uniref:Lipoprotein n=1 Tax=Haloferax gibbonsii (strain ATCC 33959 / DSM 4427 / JCM 8863 / NBRC 102184 / NCIMB 2188 / Ma 2.38) TaxID=1227459 RepID=M0HAD9_HALGM|nr:hypothetical protein [Haloferax gibbonsii]ELZ80084.1 hypothetical protein C454_12808 [Haloferax gibbonsii ATCC 33959]